MYHQLNSSIGDVTCEDPNDLSCPYEPFEYYGFLCLPQDTAKYEQGCDTIGKSPTLSPNLWQSLRPQYSNYRRRQNQSPLFVGRCSHCSKGFFKLDGVCAKCPENPYVILVAILIGFLSIGLAFYVLHTKDVNTAIFSIGVDYFQIVALFSRARIKWPRALKALFRMFSFFNFNIDLAAPECIAVFEYDQKWMLVEGVPLLIFAIMIVAVFTKFAIKAFKRYVLHQRLNSGRKLCRHASALVGLTFLLIYYLYLSLTKYTLDIFNCNPMSPPEFENGIMVTYLDATFEQCYVEGGMHERLVGMAYVSMFVYTLGFPLTTAVLLFLYRKEAFADQLLRAQDLGKRRQTNDNWEVRKMFGKLYYMFKPHKFYWVVIIIMRKAMIAFTSLMFKKNPAFQLAMALLIMFMAYAAQVLHRPYMSMVERPEVIRLAAERGELSKVNPAVKRADELRARRNKSISMRNLSERRRSNVKSRAKKSAVYFFNYNTVEMTLLGCGVLINLCGVMFSSSRFEESYYESQQEFITFIAIFIVIFSVVYYVGVCVSEVAAGSDFMKWIQWNLCCCCCPDKERIRQRNIARRRRSGEDVDDPLGEYRDADLELAHNPMMQINAATAAKKKADELALSLEAKIQEQDVINLRTAEMMKKMKKEHAQASMSASGRGRRGRGNSSAKNKKEMSQRTSSAGTAELNDDGTQQFPQKLPKKQRRMSSRELIQQQNAQKIEVEMTALPQKVPDKANGKGKSKERRMSSRELMQQQNDPKTLTEFQQKMNFNPSISRGNSTAKDKKLRAQTKSSAGEAAKLNNDSGTQQFPQKLPKKQRRMSSRELMQQQNTTGAAAASATANSGTKNTVVVNRRSSWRSSIDVKSGKTFYFDKETRDTTWKKPTDFDQSENNEEDDFKCERGCGFRGPFAEVERHEGGCKFVA